MNINPPYVTTTTNNPSIHPPYVHPNPPSTVHAIVPNGNITPPSTPSTITPQKPPSSATVIAKPKSFILEHANLFTPFLIISSIIIGIIIVVGLSLYFFTSVLPISYLSSASNILLFYSSIPHSSSSSIIQQQQHSSSSSSLIQQIPFGTSLSGSPYYSSSSSASASVAISPSISSSSSSFTPSIISNILFNTLFVGSPNIVTTAAATHEAWNIPISSSLSQALQLSSCQTICTQYDGCVGFTLLTSPSSSCSLYYEITGSTYSSTSISMYILPNVTITSPSISYVVYYSPLIGSSLIVTNPVNVSSTNADSALQLCIAKCQQLLGCQAVSLSITSSIYPLWNCNPYSNVLQLTTSTSTGYVPDTTGTISALLSPIVPQSTPSTFAYSKLPSIPLTAPARGWNSYDSYTWYVTDAQIRATALAMSTNGMLAAGYRYVTVDWKWEINIDNTAVNLDSLTGLLLPDSTRFPSGFAALSAYVHSLGLLFGIHVEPGIINVASSTIRNTLTNMIYCSNSNNVNCVSSNTGSNDDMIYLDPNPSIANNQKFIHSLVNQWISWGVDFVKLDHIGAGSYIAIVDGAKALPDQAMFYRNAISNSSNPNIILSLSAGVLDDQSSRRDFSRTSHLYRIGDDFSDSWTLLIHELNKVAVSIGIYEGIPTENGYSFPDMDMLPFGLLNHNGNNYPPNYATSASAFTYTQQKTVMSIWCILRSPLIYGGSLLSGETDTTSVSIVTNSYVLQKNQWGFNVTLLSWDQTRFVVQSIDSRSTIYYLTYSNIGSSTTLRDVIGTPYGQFCTLYEAWSQTTLYNVSYYSFQVVQYATIDITFSNCTTIPNANPITYLFSWSMWPFVNVSYVPYYVIAGLPTGAPQFVLDTSYVSCSTNIGTQADSTSVFAYIPTLYNTERYCAGGTLTYSFNLAPGIWNLEIGFVEQSGTNHARSFSITMNTNLLLNPALCIWCQTLANNVVLVVAFIGIQINNTGALTTINFGVVGGTPKVNWLSLTPATLITSTWQSLYYTSTTPFTDTSGNNWMSIVPYLSGQNANAVTTSNTISNTATQTLYQAYYIGTALTILLYVPSSRTYTITLLWAETVYNTAGARVFNLLLNNQLWLSNYDIYVAAGNTQNYAVSATTTISKSNGILLFTFQPVSGALPIFNSIQIL